MSMGRRGVSREAVEVARDALIAAGLAPSVRTVREKLGHTGSLTTIAEHLRAIEADRAQGPGPVLPDALVRGLLGGASALWRDLAEAADALVDDARRSAAAGIAAMRTERDAALERAARASDELGANRATIHSLERHLAETSARVARLDGELDEARAATRSAEADGRERGDERDALDRELVALRAETDAERRAATEARADHAARAAELHAALDVERAARDKERLAGETRLAEHKAALSEAMTASARATDRGDLLDTRFRERTAERDAARAELSELETRTQDLVVERETRAATHDAHVTALLERLVADERSSQVLDLLETLGRRMGTMTHGSTSDGVD